MPTHEGMGVVDGLGTMLLKKTNGKLYLNRLLDISSIKEMSCLPETQSQRPDATTDFIRVMSLKNQVALAQPGLKCLKATSRISRN